MLYMPYVHKCCCNGYNILLKWHKTECVFQIYLTSILHTYKVSRKLQNIYHYQEGIIMLRSKDKTICKTQRRSRVSFLSLAPMFYCHGYEKISHICTKKSQDIILYKAPFYKKVCTQNPSVYDNCMSYVKNHFKATI